MKVFHMEAALCDEDDVKGKPLKISIWADHCKIEQGSNYLFRGFLAPPVPSTLVTISCLPA